MAKKEPDGTVSLLEANRKYMEDNKEAEKQMGGAQRAAHRAIDIAFGERRSRQCPRAETAAGRTAGRDGKQWLRSPAIPRTLTRPAPRRLRSMVSWGSHLRTRGHIRPASPPRNNGRCISHASIAGNALAWCRSRRCRKGETCRLGFQRHRFSTLCSTGCQRNRSSPPRMRRRLPAGSTATTRSSATSCCNDTLGILPQHEGCWPPIRPSQTSSGLFSTSSRKTVFASCH